MLHIIGVAHRAQARKPSFEKTEAHKAFEACLRHTVAEVQAVFVAEEDNEEFLGNRGEISIAKEIACEEDIEHRFCEPDKKERSKIGSKNFSEIALELAMAERLSDDELTIKARAIEIARYFPVRESFWLDQLNGCEDADATFVCGDIHIESFTSLLEKRGVSYRIVKRGIGRTEQDEPYYDALRYLAEHPELRNE